ncbi:MAG TPA: hypothetical protein VFB12_01775 [Ktedonobacteraceae bacterium]|nr:hypothetical protein [Ktedonobacteraceae bacterium]
MAVTRYSSQQEQNRDTYPADVNHIKIVLLNLCFAQIEQDYFIHQRRRRELA